MYDGGRFEAYPERAGWESRLATEWRFHFQTRSEELQGFLQTWLFFGLIHATFAHIEPVTEEHLTRVTGSPARKVLDTSAFPRLVDKWLRYAEAHSEQLSERFRALSHAGYIVALVQRRHARPLPTESENKHISIREFLDYTVINPLSKEVNASILLLLEFLSALNCTKIPSVPYPGITQYTMPIQQFFKSTDSLITDRMRDDGWCPYTIAQLHQRYNSTALTFVSNFERIGSLQRIIHTSLSLAGIGSEQDTSTLPQDFCSEARCAKLQLKEEEYRSKHAGTCDQSSCYEVVAHPNELNSILVGPGDTYPLIGPQLDSEDISRRITLTAYRPGLEYIAISHVWSDGLGNVAQNAIPSCQMGQLTKRVSKLLGKDLKNTYFWLDTLCVPPDQARDDEAQQAALSRMRASYENASIVLVLDSWLQTQLVQNCSDAEVLLKILTSVWNTRLWTLQEGALAETLVFAFSDGFYDADDGLERLYGDPDLMVSFLLKPVIFQRFRDIRHFREHKHSFEQIIALSHGLQSRSTSVASDEPLCLGAMLDLDVLKIARASLETRMQVFWSLVNTIPASLVFYNGPRLDTEGFRWAPRSFLRQSFDGRTIVNPLPSYTQPQIATRTDHGLHVKFPGFILTVPTKWSVGQVIWLLDDQRRLYTITTHMDTVEGALKYTDPEEEASSLSGCYKINPWALTRDDESTQPKESDTERYSLEYGHLALITIHDETQVNDGWRRGILGVIKGAPQLGDTILTRRVCEFTTARVKDAGSIETFERILTENCYKWEIGVPFGVPHPTTNCLRMACGFVTSKEQSWCVD